MDDRNLDKKVDASKEIKEAEALGGYKKGFDPFKNADIALAKLHQQAKSIRKVAQSMKNLRIDKCLCCGFPVDAEPFSL